MIRCSVIDYNYRYFIYILYKLYDSTRSFAREKLMNSFRNTKRTAWFTSNTSNDAKHAAYIAVLPKKEYFTFSNDEILVLFRRLLYMDNHLHVNTSMALLSAVLIPNIQNVILKAHRCMSVIRMDLRL